MLHQCFASRAVSGDDVDHAGGQPSFLTKLSECERRERSEFGRLQNDRVSRGQRRRNFPRQHEQRKIPRNDLANHSTRFMLRKLFLEQLRPTRVIVEMPRHERDIDIPALADGLAVVHRLEDRQQTGVFLHKARQSVEVTSASVRSQGAPFSRCGSRCAHCGIDIGRTALANAGQLFAVRRVDRVEVLSRRRRAATHRR